MEEGAKRRLVGAAVIIVLSVIFLPMLLEEEETSLPVTEEEMSIPPRPQLDSRDRPGEPPRPIESTVSGFPGAEEDILYVPEAYAKPEAEPPEDSPATVFFDVPVTVEPDLDADGEFQEAPGLPEEPAVAPATETASAPTPVVVPPIEQRPPAARTPSAERAIEQPPPPKPARQPAARKEPPQKVAPQQVAKVTPKPPAPKEAPKPAAAAPASAAKGSSRGDYSWVIQVAALKEHKRAYSLVQDLRSKGFPAYIEEAEVDQQLWHRVRVGPEIERSRIESMAASLKAKTGMQVEIRRFP